MHAKTNSPHRLRPILNVQPIRLVRFASSHSIIPTLSCSVIRAALPRNIGSGGPSTLALMA